MLIALPSSGPHSNGYSLIRKIVGLSGLGWDAPAPFDPSQTLGDALLAPTRIYVKALMPVIRSGRIKGLAHITGGGLVENPPRMTPDHLKPVIDYSSWKRPAVFDWLAKTGGVEDGEMARAFNCGIGMVLAVAAEDADGVIADLEAAGETAFVCGALKTA